MNIDNIYRSIVIDTDEEILVYRNMFGEYKDLCSKRTFLDSELEDFVSLSKIIGIRIKENLNKVFQIYHKGKYDDIYFHSTYIGDIGLAVTNEDNLIEIKIIAKNKVFEKMENEYIDLDSSESYTDNNTEVGKKFILNHRLIKKCLNEELIGIQESKNKVLSFCPKEFHK